MKKVGERKPLIEQLESPSIIRLDLGVATIFSKLLRLLVEQAFLSNSEWMGFSFVVSELCSLG